MTGKLVVIVGFLALLALPAGLVLADNGPHGGYTPTTDACAGCHRTHTAVEAKLLVDTVPSLCYTCHGNTGAGADTNVAGGLYLARDSVTESPAEGIENRGLMAGGLEFASMDTNWDGAGASAPATSSHMVNGTSGTVWGNGTIGSGAGSSIPLSCTSCHDPHGRAGASGGATYRVLRAVPLSSGAATGIDVPDETSKMYTVTDPNNKYFGQSYGSAFSGARRGRNLSSWCAQCHSRYLTSLHASGSTNSGDGIFTYRHMSQTPDTCTTCHPAQNINPVDLGPNTLWSHQMDCVTCHVAHGTSASMAGSAASVAWPGGASSPSGNARSALLRVDNRGTCELCHDKRDQ